MTSREIERNDVGNYGSPNLQGQAFAKSGIASVSISVSGVEQATYALASAIERLSKSRAMICERLERILRPSEQSNKNVGLDPAEATSHIAGLIAEYARAIHAEASAIEALTARVDL